MKLQERIAQLLCDQWTDDIGPTTHDFKNIDHWATYVAAVLVTELDLDALSCPRCQAMIWERSE